MELDIQKLEAGFVNVKIGRLSNSVIKVLGLNRSECDIIMWEDRFKYIHKHVCDFDKPEDFNKCVSLIPEVIANPEYIAIHPTKNSLEFIKRINKLFIVVVRIKQTGNLALRTAYPLTEDQLNDYIDTGTAVRIQ